MDIPKILGLLFSIIGSLCFLLHGMKMMSDGIQNSAGEKLQSALHFMTKNRFVGLLTGCLLTMIIQSSGATTVMVVSFVNASLISLTQAIAVIFGANIGTTITAWIVALFGFNFKIAALAIPLFGLGYLISNTKRIKNPGLGQAIMGFGMLFIALDWLSSSISLNADNMGILPAMQKLGVFSIPLGFLIGILITALIHSSSAMTAIVITMAYNRILGWEFSCAIVIGSNIGSTVDSIMAAIGSSPNAKRTALVHVLFNSLVAILALIFIKPFAALIDFIVPGKVEDNMTYHIAMLHTSFNFAGTFIFIPFVRQIATLTQKIIKENKSDLPAIYKLEFSELVAGESPTVPIVMVQKEISHMADISVEMFDRVQYGFMDRNDKFISEHYEKLVKEEDFLDQMQEQITKYLLKCESMNIDEKIRANIAVMINVTQDLESMSDDCMSIGFYLKKMTEKQYEYDKEDFDRLIPYVELAREFLQFIYKNINKALNKDQLEFANELEEQIDSERNFLKKVARKRLESGANVKAELLYIDLVRQVEKIGDRCFSIAEQLALTK